MRLFDYQDFPLRLLTPNICNLVSAIHEYKGKQELFVSAKRDVLAHLLQTAKIQSTEASNKIEDIVIPRERLGVLMGTPDVAPRNRNEQEIAGYRDALAFIHEHHDDIAFKPSWILSLHQKLYSHHPSGMGGNWKNGDNVISETDTQGRRFVRFKPLSAIETPWAMEDLCDAYNHGITQKAIDGLLLTPLFVLDFLCIHPFDDGNGRLSRLLTLLALYRVGYIVGKYVSLEYAIEQTKASYYDALAKSSEGWGEEKNDPAPFVEYLLGVTLNCYRRFEERVEGAIAFRQSKPDRIRALFDKTDVPLSKHAIRERCPDISDSTIEQTLRALRASGAIVKLGARRNATYILAAKALG